MRSRLPAAQVDAEHWWTHYGQAIVLIAAVPGPELAAARRAIDTAVGNLRENLSFLAAVGAAAAIRRDLLFYSRTPDRMAEVIGQFVDREGDANAAEKFYAELEALDDREIREALERIADQTPARVEIPPQALQPRRR